MANDWDLIKTEYVQGFVDDNGNIKLPTLMELSERYNCTYSYMKQKSSKGKWVHQKKLFKGTRQKKIQEKRLDVIITEAARFDSEALKASEKGVKEVINCLNKSDLTSLDHQKLSIALINYQKVGLLALGEPTERVNNDNIHDLRTDDTIKEINDPGYIMAKRKKMDEKYYDKKK